MFRCHTLAAIALAAVLCAPAALLAQTPAGPEAAIRGTWRGTSTCVDKARDTACRDEEVIYVVEPDPDRSGSLRMSADKIVGGARQPMGAFDLRYDAGAHRWTAELEMRVHALWSFEPQGDRLSGTLTELPSGRLIRRVSARRAP